MKHSGQTVLWELWAALCLCTALVLPPEQLLQPVQRQSLAALCGT